MKLKYYRDINRRFLFKYFNINYLYFYFLQGFITAFGCLAVYIAKKNFLFDYVHSICIVLLFDMRKIQAVK